MFLKIAKSKTVGIWIYFGLTVEKNTLLLLLTEWLLIDNIWNITLWTTSFRQYPVEKLIMIYIIFGAVLGTFSNFAGATGLYLGKPVDAIKDNLN